MILKLSRFLRVWHPATKMLNSWATSGPAACSNNPIGPRCRTGKKTPIKTMNDEQNREDIPGRPRDLNLSQGGMYISPDRNAGRPQLGRKGNVRCRGVLEIAFNTPEMDIPPWYWFRWTRWRCWSRVRSGTLLRRPGERRSASPTPPWCWPGPAGSRNPRPRVPIAQDDGVPGRSRAGGQPGPAILHTGQGLSPRALLLHKQVIERV